LLNIITLGYFITMFTRLSKTFRGSNLCDFSYYSVLPFVFCDKKGSNFFIWTVIVFLTGQVIFVPK